MSRRLVLVIGLVALQAMALVTVLGITYWASQDVLLRYADGLTARIARDTTAYTEDYLDRANAAVLMSDRLFESSTVDPLARPRLTRYLFDLLQMQTDFDGAYVGFETGDFVFVSRERLREDADFRVKIVQTRPERKVTLTWYKADFRVVDRREEPQDDFDPRTRPWYSASLENDGISWTSPYIFFTAQEPGVTVAVPVGDPVSGRIAGAVGIDINIDSLSGFLAGLDISPRGSAAIVAENGEIIAHSDVGLVSSTGPDGALRFNTLEAGQDPVLTRAAGSIGGGLENLFPGEIRISRFRAGDEVWLAAVQRLPLEHTPWTVVTWLPEADILEPLRAVRTTALYVALAALAATALLGFVYGRAVMRRPASGPPSGPPAA